MLLMISADLLLHVFSAELRMVFQPSPTHRPTTNIIFNHKIYDNPSNYEKLSSGGPTLNCCEITRGTECLSIVTPIVSFNEM